MKKFTLSAIVAASLVSVASGATNAELEERIKVLEEMVAGSQKKIENTQSAIGEFRKNHAFDNIKFGVDFRNAIEALDYKNNTTGESAKNSSLLTSRLYLTMMARPTDKIIFRGKLAIYSLWGAKLFENDSGLKDWSASSKATDTAMRLKEAYFTYTTKHGEQPVTYSVGRRPSTDGFLANYRENQPVEGSPLAHITNMEVNALMVKLDWSRFVSGAYSKLVAGRAHTGAITGVYSTGHTTPWGPNADVAGSEDDNVDFFVTVGDVYNNGQYQLMYQWAHIFNTKGENISTGEKRVGAGSADLFSLGFKVDGFGDEIDGFLANTTAFISAAYSYYSADNGYQLLGSADGGSRSGSSIWAGVIFPDMITEKGKIGLEYNQGSKYWTPMTWAEDTSIGSKISVRGSAYEAYWNFDLFGEKNLPSQIRYTYAQHDYTPTVNCAGWVNVEKEDITAQNLRFSVSYRY